MAKYPVLTASRFCVLMLIAGLHSQVSWAAPQATATQAATVTQKAAAPAETQDETESAEADEDSLEYVRIRRNERRLAVALETSVIQFGESTKYPNATIDLIGAIHLGEPQYYKQLNDKFSDYDALLFEAVMPEEAVKQNFRPGRAKGAGRSLSEEDEWTEAKVGLQAISVLQLGMKDALGLEFQLAGIDYTARNFVHADMTQEEFEASMERRGESFSEMLLREMSKAAVQQQDKNPMAQQLDLMFSMILSDRIYRVRRIAAVELAKANEGTAFASEDGTSTIITERNIKALQILSRELKAGKKKIGIFYGAGHFPDMEERIVKEFGFKRQSEEWVTAWQLRAPKE
ncbi:MAG: hypothetical protein WAO83_22510 [Fuerstiella sp.]